MSQVLSDILPSALLLIYDYPSTANYRLSLCFALRSGFSELNRPLHQPQAILLWPRSMVPFRYFITSRFMDYLVSFLNSATQYLTCISFSLSCQPSLTGCIQVSYRNPERRKNDIQMPLSSVISVYKMNKRCPIYFSQGFICSSRLSCLSALSSVSSLSCRAPLSLQSWS